jgi:hypothetical protein
MRHQATLSWLIGTDRYIDTPDYRVKSWAAFLLEMPAKRPEDRRERIGTLAAPE